MTSMMWFLQRSGYGDAEWLYLQVTLQAAVVVASLWALAALAVPHTYEGIQLNSVGHVNQSVIYIVICFGALVGGVAAYWRAMTRGWRAALARCDRSCCSRRYSPSGSRAARGHRDRRRAGVRRLWRKRSLAPILWTAVAIAAFAGAISTLDTDMRRKQEFALDSPHPLLNERYPIWQQALTAWRAHPAFGVGGDNFDDITPARVEAWQAAEGRALRPRDVRTELARAQPLPQHAGGARRARGWRCSSCFCVAWAVSLLRGTAGRRPTRRSQWFVWSGAAAGAGRRPSASALFNTTLHDEHGLLALMLLGIWLGYVRTTCHAAASPAGRADPRGRVATRRDPRALSVVAGRATAAARRPRRRRLLRQRLHRRAGRRHVLGNPRLEARAHFGVVGGAIALAPRDHLADRVLVRLARLRDAQLRVRRGLRRLLGGEQLLEELLAGTQAGEHDARPRPDWRRRGGSGRARGRRCAPARPCRARGSRRPCPAAPPAAAAASPRTAT